MTLSALDHVTIRTARLAELTGFYSEVQRPTRLVHSIEHGHVVVYYESPGPAAQQFLKDWTGLYDGHWDGLIAVPAPGLGQAVVLTAWTKLIRLDPFDPSAAAAFTAASYGVRPSSRSCLANSTMRMAVFADNPISRTSPICM